MPLDTGELDISMVLSGVTVVAIGVIIFLLAKAFLFVRGILISVLRKRIDPDKRDPERTFSTKDRRVLEELCGGRCEGTGLFFRCRHKNSRLHGDHWFPHSRGGKTSQKNLVLLCAKCNRRKTCDVPTIFQTMALRRRRKKYVPKDSVYLSPGEWF